MQKSIIQTTLFKSTFFNSHIGAITMAHGPKVPAIIRVNVIVTRKLHIIQPKKRRAGHISATKRKNSFVTCV